MAAQLSAELCGPFLGKGKRVDVSRFHVGDKDQVGPLLTRLRQESGLTSRQAAGRAGVGQASLIQWETGHHCPNVASLNKMLRFYRVTVTMGWQS